MVAVFGGTSETRGRGVAVAATCSTFGVFVFTRVAVVIGSAPHANPSVQESRFLFVWVHVSPIAWKFFSLLAARTVRTAAAGRAVGTAFLWLFATVVT